MRAGMMKYGLLWVVLVVKQGMAQDNHILSGFVKGGGRPLVSASIQINNASILSDSNGFYKMEIRKKQVYQMRVSYIGFETITRNLMAESDLSIHADYNLEPVQSLLNQVVVTGVSRATRIRENPVAIQFVSSKTIDRSIEPNIIDALVKNVPGLNAVKTGPNISKPFIRGLGYNRVLTLYDGIRQEGQQWGDEHGIEVDAYNISKAEVIKGPASIMFGSDAVAGVVSLYPYLPDEKDGKIYGRFLSEYQGNNGLIGNGIRLGFSNAHWMWTVKGSYRIAKNYTNAIDGRVYNTGFRETNAAATIGYISEKGMTTLNATLYNNLQGIPDGSRDSATRQFTKQIYEVPQDDIYNRPLADESELDGYALSPLHQHIQHYRIYSNSHYQLGNGFVDASLGFQQNIRREYNHPTNLAQAGLFVQLNTINYGLKYTTPEIYNMEWTIGVNGMYQYNKSKNATDFPIPDYRLADAGAFLFGKWKHDKFTLNVAIRLDTRKLSGNDFYVSTNHSIGFAQQSTASDTAATLQFPSLNKSFSGLSMSIGATYQISNHVSIKMNLARGYRSPTVTEIASNGLDPGAHIIYLGNRSFVPEFNLQEDVGVQADFHDITFSLSLFNNDVQNYIYLTQLVDASGNPVLDPQGNKTFQYQQAAARLYGLEASLNIHPDKWKGFHFDNMFALTYGINKQTNFKNAGTNGEWLPLIPPARLLSSISQTIGLRNILIPSFTLRAELEYNAAQNRYMALYHTETATPSFTLINVSVSSQLYYAGSNTIQLQFQINNLFDLAYQNNLSRLKYFEYYSQSPNGHTGIYNMGRNVCIKMLVSF